MARDDLLVVGLHRARVEQAQLGGRSERHELLIARRGQMVDGELEVAGHVVGGRLLLARLVIHDPDAGAVVGPVDAVDGAVHRVRPHLDAEPPLDVEDFGPEPLLD